MAFVRDPRAVDEVSLPRELVQQLFAAAGSALGGINRERDGDSPPERAPKRLRRSDEKSEGDDDGLSLPLEVWAGVMEYLPFDDILTCGATSRSMLKDVMPLIKALRFDRPSQLNLAVSSRFRDIEEIRIDSLLQRTLAVFDVDEVDEEVHSIEVNIDTSIRVVPFLSRFCMLERVIFGGRDEGGTVNSFSPLDGTFFSSEEGDEGDEDDHDGNRERMRSLINSISGAFSCRALPNNLRISGLCCPTINGIRVRHGLCKTCSRACRNFPLESVVTFEAGGSSIASARSGRMYELDVCLQRGEIESIIESRPGGKELLHSEGRLLRLLGCGRRYEIVARGKPLYFVKYDSYQTTAIKRAIEYAGLSVDVIDPLMIEEAVLRSFAADDKKSIPTKAERFMAESSLRFLTDEIGLRFDIAASQLEDLAEHVDHIAFVLQKRYESATDTGAEEYRDIEFDCLRAIRKVLEMENKPSRRVAEIVDSQVVPYLTHQMTSRNLALNNRLESDQYLVETASALKIIITKHPKWVTDKALLKPFGILLGWSDTSVVNDAILSLAVIIRNRRLLKHMNHVDMWANSGTVRTLVRLVKSGDDAIVNSALKLLADLVISSHPSIAVAAIENVGNIAASSQEHCKTLMQAGLLKCLNLCLQKPSRAKLFSATEACAKLFRYTHVDLASTKASLKLLTPLLRDTNDDVACNSCEAIYYLLGRLEIREVCEVISVGLVKSLLGLLPKTLPYVAVEKVMELLHIVTQAGEDYTKEITRCDGIKAISRALSYYTPRMGTNMEHFACLAASKALSGNRDHIQFIIDCGIASRLIKMLRRAEHIMHTLWAIYQIIKEGTLTQIKQIANQELTDTLCDILLCEEDSRTTNVSILTLKNILNAGETLAGLDGRSMSHASDVKMIKARLDDLTEENKRLAKLQDRMNLPENTDRMASIDAMKTGLRRLFETAGDFNAPQAAKENVQPKRAEQNTGMKTKKRKQEEEEQQKLFSMCEETFCPMMDRLTVAKDASNVKSALKCINSIMERVELLTPSFLLAYPLGMLVKSVRKLFEKDYPQVKEQCKELTVQMKRVYSEKEATVPDGFKGVKKRILNSANRACMTYS